MSFDESLLDDPSGLARADVHGRLLGAAGAGARVRTAARNAAEAGLADLRPDGRPRAVLVAGPGPRTARVADLLGALAACPVLALPVGGTAPAPHERRWTLPGWTGSFDLLLIATEDGTEPGLTQLIEHAYRRGCAVVAVAPDRTPLADALRQSRGFLLPYAPPRPGERPGPDGDPGAFWALLTPSLALADRLGLLTAPPAAVEALADRLDTVAERFGPTADTYRNPAKALTTELADALPLLWSEGPVTGPVARRFADLLVRRTGRPALAAALPEAADAHAALLDTTGPPGGDDLNDFFRDRVETPRTVFPRVVLLREPGATARPLTLVPHDTAVSAIDAPQGTTTESLAELLALTDFASAYLALATGPATGPAGAEEPSR